jgi:hypothetical protein
MLSHSDFEVMSECFADSMYRMLNFKRKVTITHTQKNSNSPESNDRALFTVQHKIGECEQASFGKK